MAMSDENLKNLFGNIEPWDWDEINGLEVTVYVERDTMDGVTIRSITLIDEKNDVKYLVECKPVEDK